MNLQKIAPSPGNLVEFFEEGINALGGLCERPWHNQLEVVAEGDAARLWQSDGSLFSGELSFPEEAGPRDARRDVFGGCPLTFALAEALWAKAGRWHRFSAAAEVKAPPMDTAQRLWIAEFGAAPQWRATPLVATEHFSVVITVRCEIQAIDQAWSCHRLAFSLPTGVRDSALEGALDHFTAATHGPDPEWPDLDPAMLSQWVASSLTADMAHELASVKTRQQRYLQRELDRIEGYFNQYEAELTERMGRQRKAESKQRYEERLHAAKSDHQRKCSEQIARHAIRVVPHLDGCLLLAEPAFRTRIHWVAGGEAHETPAVFVPRIRRWFR